MEKVPSPDGGKARELRVRGADDVEFELVFRNEPVRGWAEAFQKRRLGMLARIWLLPVAGAAALAAGLRFLAPEPSMVPIDWWVALYFLVLFFLTGVVVLGFALLERGKAAVKRPALEAIARARRLTYRADGFENPIGTEATALLIGHRPFSGESWTDLFHGLYPDGAGFLICDAVLTRGHGRSAHTFFGGAVHAYGRHGSEAQTVIRSRRGLSDRLWPEWPFDLVAIGGDPQVEREFAFCSTDAREAERLLTETGLGRFLLDLRRSGRIFVYIGPHSAILAIAVRDRFEIGAVSSWRGARPRARRMWDQVRASERLLQRFRELVG